MLCLYVEAPFAVCRTFTAGWYRPTATFLTPSAAYGLVLNVAGIESRLWEHDTGHDGKTPASLMRQNLPAVRIALGAKPTNIGHENDPYPRVQTIYQQLHNYPVGADAGMPAEMAKGNKNNITPVRRELLCNLRAFICLDGNSDLEDRVRRGLRGEFNGTRYGLPFLGDNQFLLDRLELVGTEAGDAVPPRAIWYEKIEQTAADGPRPRTTRLTIWIDRADMSKTRSALFSPIETATGVIPETAWISIEPPRSDEAITARTARPRS